MTVAVRRSDFSRAAMFVFKSWVLIGALLGAIHVSGAQELPMTFAKPAPALLDQFESDWRRISPHGREWAYCVSQWSSGSTQDGDTVYLARKAELIPAEAERSSTRGFDCVSADGTLLPIVHAHPGGDCSPSRADAATAIGQGNVPFALILCGPRSTVGYSGRQFELMLRGRLWELQATAAIQNAFRD
jgi:hypothetical protein